MSTDKLNFWRENCRLTHYVCTLPCRDASDRPKIKCVILSGGRKPEVELLRVERSEQAKARGTSGICYRLSITPARCKNISYCLAKKTIHIVMGYVRTIRCRGDSPPLWRIARPREMCLHKFIAKETHKAHANSF